MGKYKIEIKWGVVITLAMIAWLVVEKMAGWHDELIESHAAMTNLFTVVALVIYYFALLDKRKHDLGGKMTWTDGFMCGFAITVVAALLNPIAQLLLLYVISPEFLKNLADYMVQMGHMSRSEAGGVFTPVYIIIQGFLGALMMGVLVSALVAIITQKK
jgi:hypothetical protein